MCSHFDRLNINLTTFDFASSSALVPNVLHMVCSRFEAFPVHRNQSWLRIENLAGRRLPAISYMPRWHFVVFLFQ